MSLLLLVPEQQKGRKKMCNSCTGINASRVAAVVLARPAADALGRQGMRSIVLSESAEVLRGFLLMCKKKIQTKRDKMIIMLGWKQVVNTDGFSHR